MSVFRFRVYFIFNFIVFVAGYLIWLLVCMQAKLVQKGQLLEAILEQQEAVHKDGWHVATS